MALQYYLADIVWFINTAIIPLLIAVAFLFFIFNVVRFFIASADSPRGRESAQMLALYGLGAFVILFAFWGIIGFLAGGLGLYDTRPVCPDYLGGWCDASPFFFFFEFGFGDFSSGEFYGSEGDDTLGDSPFVDEL